MGIKLDDLKAEKASIEEQMSKLHIKIDVLTQQSTELFQELNAINYLIKKRSSDTSDITKHLAKAAMLGINEQKLNEACLTVIKSNSEVWRPVDVYNALKTLNYPFKSKTPDCSVALALQNLAKKIKIRNVSGDSSKNKYRRIIRSVRPSRKTDYTGLAVKVLKGE